MKRNHLCVILVLLVPSFFYSEIALASQSKFYESLEKFFKANFPGEGFIPTPYGADSRFRPKSIWILLDSAQKNAKKARKQRAWFRASNGLKVFDTEAVPIFKEPITPGAWVLDKETKWSLATSLAGAVEAVELEAELSAAFSSGLDVDIKWGSVEIEYCNYFDMSAAQIANSRHLGFINQALKARYKKDLPERRVITAAIRVKDTVITVNRQSAQDVEIGAEVESFLKKLGVGYNRELKSFQTLEVKDWKYIAYQAIVTNQDMLIGAGDTGAAAPGRYDSFAFKSENVPWSYPK